MVAVEVVIVVDTSVVEEEEEKIAEAAVLLVAVVVVAVIEKKQRWQIYMKKIGKKQKKVSKSCIKCHKNTSFTRVKTFHTGKHM